MTDLFVYGTLKRGGKNHARMAGQTFVSNARTVSGYRLFLLDGYPGMVPWTADNDGVIGEIWRVDASCLAALDQFEGIYEGLYRREPVMLISPLGKDVVQTYIYAQSVAGREEIGSTWREE